MSPARQPGAAGGERFVLGMALGRWQTNCWIVGDRGLGRAVVVDPGEGGAIQVPSLLEQHQVTCEAILLTHGHLDHLWAVPELADELDVPVLLHPDDRWLWDDPAAGLGLPRQMLAEFGLDPWDPPSDHLDELRDGQTLSLAGIELSVRHTPGHTPGHVVFLAHGLADAPVDFHLGSASSASSDVLLSGDLLFAGSIGRTDLPGGSSSAMADSLAATLPPLEDEMLVLTGHGPDTTIGRERARNAFLRQLAVHRR